MEGEKGGGGGQMSGIAKYRRYMQSQSEQVTA
jgi:hypothetical protein